MSYSSDEESSLVDENYHFPGDIGIPHLASQSLGSPFTLQYRPLEPPNGCPTLEAEKNTAAACPICLEPSMKKPVKLEGCGHSFCITRIVNWQRHGKKARKEHVDFGSSSSCPLFCDSSVNVENALLQQASYLAGKAAMDASLNAKEKTKLRRQALSHLDLLLSNTNGTIIQALFTKAGILVHLKEGIEALHLLEQIEQVLVIHSMHPANQALLDQPSAVSEDEMERCQEV